MSDFLTFAGAHPVMATLFFFIAAMIVGGVLKLPFQLVNRWIRHKNIVAKGWPPAHLDADGDWREESQRADRR